MKVLFVDDDPNLLSAIERTFRNSYPLDTAQGGEAGLKLIAERGPYAVVVADRQMPEMDGVKFLTAVKRCAPDTVRIMLTGNADLDSAIEVVNEGNIFRFLTKPCPHATLRKAIEDARSLYQLTIAEKELLNKTVTGSIKLLTDILSTVDIRSFAQTERLRGLVSDVVAKIPMENPWELHLAAMLAPIGYLTLPPETLVKAREELMLSKAEELLVARVPEIASRLLANIPRLEGVARIVRYQHKQFDGGGFPPDAVKEEEIPLGARLLKILADASEIHDGRTLPLRALNELQTRVGWYDPDLLAKVRVCFGGQETSGADEVRRISVSIKDLEVGMVLRSDVITQDGTLILSSGHQLNEMSIEKILNFHQISGIRQPIFVDASAKPASPDS